MTSPDGVQPEKMACRVSIGIYVIIPCAFGKDAVRGDNLLTATTLPSYGLP